MKDPVIDERVVLKWILEKWSGGHLAEDRDRWRSVVNTVMNLPVS